MRLVVRVERTGVCNILENIIGVQFVPLSDGSYALTSKSSLCVDIQSLPFTASFVKRELASYTQLMTKLALSCSEFSKKFSD
mmetsp:Transcript_33023/g.83029  ORF Transcript_33023/g.83029 Transcript_33023/m.83029 type:complete len:82 (+) Transcript_33023:418-663(+)